MTECVSSFLTESSKSPASIAKSNKQWVEQLFGYEQVAKRIANIRLIPNKQVGKRMILSS